MQDDHLEQPLRDAALAYHVPPDLDAPSRHAIWHVIEMASPRVPITHPRRPAIPAWAGLAAAVVLGIALGRFTPIDRLLHPISPAPAASVATGHARLPLPAPLEPATSEYLGQTTALLSALPTAARADHADKQFIDRAANLLLTTRLLLDSPAARDPKLRRLLDDLEVVLAQVVRLQAEPDSTDLDLINQALQQRDVLPRLRTAAADISAD
jgi:hypothetical protein